MTSSAYPHCPRPTRSVHDDPHMYIRPVPSGNLFASQGRRCQPVEATELARRSAKTSAGFVAEDMAWPVVEFGCHAVEVGLVVVQQLGQSREGQVGPIRSLRAQAERSNTSMPPLPQVVIAVRPPVTAWSPPNSPPPMDDVPGIISDSAKNPPAVMGFALFPFPLRDCHERSPARWDPSRPA